MITYLLRGFGLGFAAAAQPGPFQAYLINQSISQGWRKTAIAAIAPIISDGPIILLVLLVLKQIPIWLQNLLYLAGGGFIVFLGWVSFEQWRKFNPDGVYLAGIPHRSLIRAALTNLLSPGPYLFWSLVTGPILISGWHISPVYGLVFLLAFYGTMILVNLMIILMVGQTNRLGDRFRRSMIGLSSLALFLFGAWQLGQGIMNI